MGLRLPQYLKDNGLMLLLASDAKFLPGLIVEKQGPGGFWPVDRLQRLFKGDDLCWDVERIEADLPDSVSGRKAVDASGKLELPFLSIGADAGLKGNSTVDFKIGAVRERVFASEELALWAPLSRRLARLRRERPSDWERVKGRWVVMSTWYATEYTLDLGRALAGEIDASFRRHIAVGTGAKLALESGTRIVCVSGNDRVPFAFHGRRLVKIT